MNADPDYIPTREDRKLASDTLDEAESAILAFIARREIQALPLELGLEVEQALRTAAEMIRDYKDAG